MLALPRRPSSTTRIFSSAEKCRRVARRMSWTIRSAGALTGSGFGLIFAPDGYDDPEILRSRIPSICPTGADGGQYMAHDFQKELRFLGTESSPAFVRAPEGNGCAERFIRTLKENLLWVRGFATVEELRQALLAFREAYNAAWLIERHGFRP